MASARQPEQLALDKAMAGHFAQVFLKEYLASGFASLSKGDLDLLVFYTLELTGHVDKLASNHAVAAQLRITPSRAATLRRNAYARWSTPVERMSFLDVALQRALEPAAVEGALASLTERERLDGFFPLHVEHPVARDELENQLKLLGVVPRAGRNREVTLVRLGALVDLLEARALARPGTLGRVEAALKGKAGLKEVLTQDLTRLKPAEARVALNELGVKVIEHGVPKLVLAALGVGHAS